jgi:glucose-6-phosphate isomerase
MAASTEHRAPVITQTPEWEAVARHEQTALNLSLRNVFHSDPTRASRMSLQAGELFLDYSKHLVTDEILSDLLSLARAAKVKEGFEEMFSGVHLNVSENRAVLHVALRMPKGTSLVVDGTDVVAEVHQVLDKMEDLANQIRSGQWKGSTGKPIKTVVNIGIGGSDLGPVMAYKAMEDYLDAGITCRFVSNVDPTDLWANTSDLDPATTLFVVCSKTFTTLETLTNAAAARDWLLRELGVGQEAVARHFLAVSTNASAVEKFGIDPSNMLGFWDWVGGRYSYDSAIGFSLMVAIGPERFREMLAGFHAIDEHVLSAPLESNMAVICGMLNVFYNNFLGAQTHAVLPYSHRMSRFPAYLQQLTMESNGKSVRLDGTAVDLQTGEIFWGEPGTNGQHAFYQLMHQGTKLIPADLICFAEPIHEIGTQHDLLVANCLAQSAALAFGRTAEELAAQGVPPHLIPHKVMPGNRPTSVIMAPRLTPSVLGQLVALYEHTVFVEGRIWGIDSFDQWGVELGKELANKLSPALVSPEPSPPDDPLLSDSSTTGLIERYRSLRGR